MSELSGAKLLRARRSLVAALALAAAWLAIPAAAQAANDLGVTQALSATKAKPGGKIEVTSTVTNLGTETSEATYVELATLKGKILTFGANDPYSGVSDLPRQLRR